MAIRICMTSLTMILFVSVIFMLNPVLVQAKILNQSDGSNQLDELKTQTRLVQHAQSTHMISEPTTDIGRLYQHTVYNNYAALAFDRSCGALTDEQRNAVQRNIQLLATDFRDEFRFERDQWVGMISEMEQRYRSNQPDCENKRARQFSRSLADDIRQITEK